jgi:hypothetical protein
MSIAEKVLDAFFEYRLIHDGCDAVVENRPVYLKRWFLVKNLAQEGGTHMPSVVNLTIGREGNGRQMFLHKFFRSDNDRELHDHPWDFTSIILWRGYREETEDASCAVCRRLAEIGKEGLHHTVVKRKWPGAILHRKAEHRHRVQLIDDKPSWSLFFTTFKKRSWGFWRDGNFIPWRHFISKKCEDQNGQA